MKYVGNGRNYFYDGLFDAEEQQDAEQRRAFAREREAQDERIRVLREALEVARNGLAWYIDMHPDEANDSDAETMAQIEAALEATK